MLFFWWSSKFYVVEFVDWNVLEYRVCYCFENILFVFFFVKMYEFINFEIIFFKEEYIEKFEDC